MEKVKRENIAEHITVYQLNLIGKTLEDAKTVPEWSNIGVLTEKQFQELQKYAIPLLKKVFKINTNKAKGIFKWWYLQFGLPIINNET